MSIKVNVVQEFKVQFLKLNNKLTSLCRIQNLPDIEVEADTNTEVTNWDTWNSEEIKVATNGDAGKKLTDVKTLNFIGIHKTSKASAASLLNI